MPSKYKRIKKQVEEISKTLDILKEKRSRARFVKALKTIDTIESMTRSQDNKDPLLTLSQVNKLCRELFTNPQ